MKTAIASLVNPKFSKFFIRLKDPTKIYFPGEVINGYVIIQGSKMVRGSCIKLEFRGKVMTNIVETKVFYINEQSIKLNDEPEFDPIETYQQFSFNLTLPTDDLISNCSLAHCSVSYKFKALFKPKSWLPDSTSPKCSARVNILDKIDIVNYSPPFIKPFSIDVKGSVKKSKKMGSAKVEIEIGHGAVLKGQTIPIRIYLEHFVPIKNLDGVLIALYRKISAASSSGKENSKLKIINASTSPILIDPKTLNAVINTKVPIPNNGDDDNDDNIITPTIKIGKNHLLVEYFIEIIVDLTIKKTIYESSKKSSYTTMTTSKYLNLKEKTGKYNANFNIPIIIGTFDRRGGRGSQNNQSLEVPTIIHSHFNSHPSDLSTNSVILWTGNASPTPSAPSVNEIGLYDDEFELYYSSEIIQN
nr:8276_t:CDS:2 [Entrophospora candida]CAG8550529.1 6108_t:CDS:2 [Entrophospora candida]